MYQKKPGIYYWNWILQVLDQGDLNVRLDKQEFINLGALSRDTGFNDSKDPRRQGKFTVSVILRSLENTMAHA